MNEIVTDSAVEAILADMEAEIAAAMERARARLTELLGPDEPPADGEAAPEG
jgi:hypothetical protein